MTQVNNNAESLSRELRKFKNLKSVDFKGLLSGTAESYVNLYRYLFCESNVAFSQLVLDKGYDLTGLNDFKFMEAIYRMMRDFLDMKPAINQNQFFSPGFTQRKLEMSTIIAAQVRKMTNDLLNKNGKKTVQTQSLMKSSLKRSNSAPKHARVIEMGDEPEVPKTKTSHQKYKKNKSTNVYHENGAPVRHRRGLAAGDTCQSSDELSDESEVACSYNSQQRMNPLSKGNNYDSRSKTLVERLDQAQTYSPQSRPLNQDNLADSTYESRPNPFVESKPYSSSFNYQRPADVADISAFEFVTSDTEKFRSRNNHQERLYDVKQYAPSTYNESSSLRKDQNAPEWEKIMQQFETVLARITLLEGRMQRIETKLETNVTISGDRQKAAVSYPSQGNFSNTEYMSSYDHNTDSRVNSYTSKTNNSVKGIKEAIPDFESHHATLRPKLDSDRSYTSSNYSTNFKALSSSDYTFSAPRYTTNYTNHAEPSKHIQDTQSSNGYRDNCYSLSSPYTSAQGSSGPTDSYQHTGKTYSAPQHTHKTSNGIPPLYPTTKKVETSSNREPRAMKQSDEKVLSQTDRIASMLSDTQKMLRLSDEEL